MLDAVALLERAPAGVRRLAYRIAAGRGPLGRLADAARYRYSERDVPAVPAQSDAAVRITIGPANSAGQAYRWARALERDLPGVAAVAVHGIAANPFQPPADVHVPVAVALRSAAWHAAFEAFLARQTHVIWESGLPLLGRRHGSDVLRESEALAQSGVHGALMFHGSDIRPPERHAAASAWSPFRDAAGPVRALADTAAANAALVAASGLPVFVSTPDLLQWVPDATWCPVVVDPGAWSAVSSRRPPSRRPVVVHAPTQRWLKGTERIEPMLRRLSEEGVIDYRPIVGVPHSSMPAVYAEADIVLDQFLLGSYGVAACEALAAGRLVMGHVDAATRARVVELSGCELPIVEATVDSLEAELRSAAGEPERAREAGPAFVAAVHDGRASASALAAFLGVSAS